MMKSQATENYVDIIKVLQLHTLPELKIDSYSGHNCTELQAKGQSLQPSKGKINNKFHWRLNIQVSSLGKPEVQENKILKEKLYRRFLSFLGKISRPPAKEHSKEKKNHTNQVITSKIKKIEMTKYCVMQADDEVQATFK